MGWKGDGRYQHGRLDGLGEELFDARISQERAEAGESVQIAGQAGLKVLATGRTQGRSGRAGRLCRADSLGTRSGSSPASCS